MFNRMLHGVLALFFLAPLLFSLHAQASVEDDALVDTVKRFYYPYTSNVNDLEQEGVPGWKNALTPIVYAQDAYFKAYEEQMVAGPVGNWQYQTYHYTRLTSLVDIPDHTFGWVNAVIEYELNRSYTEGNVRIFMHPDHRITEVDPNNWSAR